MVGAKFTKRRSSDSDSSDMLSLDDYKDGPQVVTMWQKIAFGVGGFPIQMVQNIIGFYLTVFLLETAHYPPAYMWVMSLAGQISDTIFGILMGLVVLKTKTRYGQKRPW